METNYKKLMQSVVDGSVADEWMLAKAEWVCTKRFTAKGFCECGKAIKDNYTIQNKYTKKELIVGSTCIEKFEEESMNKYLKEQHELQLKQNAYEKLKVKQMSNGIPLSVKESYLNSRYLNKVISDYEYKFYKEIWNEVKLTVKQAKLKQKINDKLIKS